MAQVEALRMLLRSGKQSLQPASKVGSLADVGLGASILAAQKKHSRSSGYGGKDLGVCLGAELEALGQHTPILIRIRCPLLKTGLRDVGVGDPLSFLTTEGTRVAQGNTGETRLRESVDPKLALLNFRRKSGPSIFTMRHISWRRERMRSPMRSPSVSSRVAARVGDNDSDSDLATLAAGGQQNSW
jgi:hypothetical protein